MKKFLIFLWIPLLFLIGGCTNKDKEDFSAQIKMEINHITESEANKNIDITYPTVGGLADARTLATINNSIQNYVDIQEKEFNNALVEENNNLPIEEDFDATVTKQINNTKDKEADEDESDSSSNEDTNSNDNENTDGDNQKKNNSGSEESANPEDEPVADNPEDSGQPENATPISLTMGFDITYHKNNILNILVTYKKVLGEGKTYIGQQSFVFDLEKGIPITIGELYDFSSDFPAIINKSITKSLKKDTGYQLYNDKSGFSGISKDASYYIDEKEKKIYIFYNALEISPEKNKIPTFVFSFSELNPYLTETYSTQLK